MTKRPYALIATFGLLCLLLAGTGVQAGGIKFDEIPVGTQFHYKGTDGMPSSVRVYTGVQNGRHEMRHYFRRGAGYKTTPFRITFYDAQGRMVEMHKTGFNMRVEFAPFNCEYSSARTCTHTRSVFDASGKRTNTQTRAFSITGNARTKTMYRGAAKGTPNLRITRDARNIETRRDEWALNEKMTAKLVEERAP